MEYKMIVIGKNVAMELLKNDSKINKVYLYKDFNDKNIINDIQKRYIQILQINKNRIVNYTKHI